MIRVSEIFSDIREERERQESKWGEQNHPDGTGIAYKLEAHIARDRCQAVAQLGLITWHDILAEEVCEAFAEDDPIKLRQELIQVAAVAVAWIEKLDRALT